MKEGWEYKKLGEICQILDSQRKPVTKKDRRKGVYPYYGASGIQDYVDSYIFDGRYLLVGEDGAKWGASDKSAYIIEGKCWVNNHAHILEVSENVNDKLIEYYLKFKDLYEYITGAIVPKLTQKALTSIPIPIPPFSEQQRIVEELDLLSSIIEKKKEQLKELDNLAQSIFYNMFGDPVNNEKGWEATTIGECCVLKSGNSDANNSSLGSLPYVKVGDMNIVSNETYISTSSTFVDREENKKDIFPIGTTIFPKRGGAILTNKKRITNVEICCDLNVMGVIPNKERLHPLYIYFYFLKIDFVIFGKTGSTIPQINNHNIAPMKIGIPPLTLQQSFASKIEVVEKQKELIKQSIKEVETLFNCRMDYYFN